MSNFGVNQTVDAFWTLCLEDLRYAMPQNIYAAWFMHLQGKVSGDTLTIIAPNAHMAEHVKTSYLNDITPVVARHSKGKIGRIVFSTQNHAPTATKGHKTLNPLLTFENFVAGSSNYLAHKACLEMAKSDGIHQFLFVYGSSGLGKTHLMQATCHALHAGDYRYFSADKFTQKVVAALRAPEGDGDINAFKESLRRAHILAVDDIHLLATKTKTLLELVAIFSDFIAQGKRVILAANVHPSRLAGFDERVRGRFSQGLSVAIDPPAFETRVQILYKKAADIDAMLPQDCAEFIAQHIIQDVRQLEGAIHQVAAVARLRGNPINMMLVRQTLRDIVVVRETTSIDVIKACISEHFGVSIRDLLSSKRSRNIVRPRQIAMAMCRELTDESLVDIGKAFGGRDHTTVMHACAAVEKLKDEDAAFATQYHRLKMMAQV